MVIIGLCGSSGSGKGYICRVFNKYGVAHIDTDKVYRERVLVSAECKGELVQSFGKGILENGQVSKRRLAQIVFAEGNGERLKDLNRITHKYIKIETEKDIALYASCGYRAVIVDAPVLFESGFDKMCHVTVCVTAPYDSKVERIVQRDGVTVEQAKSRLRAQLSDERLRELCTYEVDNTDGKDLDCQVVTILKELKVE
ncbi:MAG: dephospho-CoA kinase [Clostridia bacterium]|nr:dephospho-CoA kinase [Clostridia bacterium]